MSLNLDPAVFQTVVADAILKQIGPEQRDVLITAALKSLMEVPPKTSYGSAPKSPLQEAFNHATYQIAIEVVRVEMHKPENLALFTSLVSQALQKALTDSNEMISNLASVIASAIKPPRD